MREPPSTGEKTYANTVGGKACFWVVSHCPQALRTSHRKESPCSNRIENCRLRSCSLVRIQQGAFKPNQLQKIEQALQQRSLKSQARRTPAARLDRQHQLLAKTMREHQKAATSPRIARTSRRAMQDAMGFFVGCPIHHCC